MYFKSGMQLIYMVTNGYKGLLLSWQHKPNSGRCIQNISGALARARACSLPVGEKQCVLPLDNYECSA